MTKLITEPLKAVGRGLGLNPGTHFGDAKTIQNDNRTRLDSLTPKTITTGFGDKGSSTFNYDGKGGYSTNTNIASLGAPGWMGSSGYEGLNQVNGSLSELIGRYNALDGDRSRLLALGQDLEGLKPLVAPGYSELRERRMQAVADAERRATGDLQESLGRRRIKGSSFASDTLSRNQAEFGKLASDTEAQTLLEEIDTTTRIIDFQRQVATDAAGVLVAKLSGQQAAYESISANNRAQLAADASVFSTQGTIFGAEVQQQVAELQLAFGSTELALDYFTNVSQQINENAANLTDIEIAQAGGDLEVIGTLIGATAETAAAAGGG